MLDRNLSFQELIATTEEWPSLDMQYVGSDEGARAIYVDQKLPSEGVYIGKYYFEKLTAEEITPDGPLGLIGHLAGGLIKVHMRFGYLNGWNSSDKRTKGTVMNGQTTPGGEYVLLITSVNFEAVNGDTPADHPLNYPVLVVDLETLATTADSAVTEIGAVFGDLLENRIVSSFFRVVSSDSQPSRKTSMDTVMWHEDNIADNAILRHVSLNNVGVSAMSAFADLHRFISALRKKYPNLQVITNGPEFDAAACQSMYDQLGKQFPWDFRSNQSLRTLNWLTTEFGAKSDELISFQKNQQTLNHNALFDAWKEFHIAALSFKELRRPFVKE